MGCHLGVWWRCCSGFVSECFSRISKGEKVLRLASRDGCACPKQQEHLLLNRQLLLPYLLSHIFESVSSILFSSFYVSDQYGCDYFPF